MTSPILDDSHRHFDELPLPEPPLRKAGVRFGALLACAATVAYLVWRAIWTLDGAVLWLSLPLLIVEVHNAIGLFLFTFSLWDVDPPPPPAPVDRSEARIAMLIPTYNEPIEVLLPTIAAAVAIKPAHETWVLDDGDRPEVAALARELGASYLARTDHSHAKAGNLNNALQHVQADIVGIIDADHVVDDNFLRHTLGYFDDPHLAVVQTPQCFYNENSFEHETEGRRVFSEQAVFYRVILPAKNRWKAGFWCGTGALVRVAALQRIGGVATDSVTEDIQTTIRLQRAGWNVVVHNEVLAHGLAATDAGQYWLQRHRWSQGAMQVLRGERLFTRAGLTWPQRLAYGATLFAWFDAWRILAYFAIPVAVIVTGQLPVAAPIGIYAPFFLGVLTLQFTALRLLARGYYPPIWSLVFEALRLPAVLPGTIQGLSGQPGEFKVTPKGRIETDRAHLASAGIHVVLLVVAAVSLVWLALCVGDVIPLHYANLGAVLGCAAFLTLNAVVVAAAAWRVRSLRFAGERRASVRFDTSVDISFAGVPATMLDISLTGARALVANPVPSWLPTIEGEAMLRLPGHGVELRTSIVRVAPGDEGAVVSLRFAPGQTGNLAALSLAIFQDSLADAVPVEPPLTVELIESA